MHSCLKRNPFPTAAAAVGCNVAMRLLMPVCLVLYAYALAAVAATAAWYVNNEQNRNRNTKYIYGKKYVEGNS